MFNRLPGGPVTLVILMILPVITAGGQDNMNSDDSAAALLSRGDEMFGTRRYGESREIYMKAAEAAEKSGANSDLTEALAQVARTYLIEGQQESGREWLERAAGVAGPEEPQGWSRFLGVRGRFEWKDDRLEKARETFAEMYDYCSAHELHERAVDAAHMAAIVETPEMQVTWARKGIAEAEAGNMTGWLGPLWNNLGATFEDMEKYPEALEAYLSAREYHWRYGDEMNKLIADWAVGHAYRLTGQFEKAAEWIRPVLAWSRRIKADEFTGWSYKELAEIELAGKNHKEAHESMKMAAEYLGKADMPDWDAEGYREILDRIKKLEEKIRD